MAEGGGPAHGGGQQPPPPAAPQQPIHMNWLHFKPEFSGKPDKDVEAHLLRTNDWMTTHDFPESVKVQRFCLTLVGEARNWYATLEPVAMTWPELQTMFRCQYSKIGNMREQLFHAWRSFHYAEKLTDKKRKSMTFDAKDALEKTSENMKRMTALMDKMYIKLEQKDLPYKPQIYQRGRGQNQRQFRRVNNWRGYRPFSRNRNESNRGYGCGRGNFWRGNFQGRGNF